MNFIHKYYARCYFNIKINIDNNKNIINNNSLMYFWNTNDFNTHKINIINNLKIQHNILNYTIFAKQKKYINNIIDNYNKNKILNSISYFYNYNETIDKKNEKPIFLSTKIEISNKIFNLSKIFLYNLKKDNFIQKYYYNIVKYNLYLKKYWILINNKLLISRFLIDIHFPYFYNNIIAWNIYKLRIKNIKNYLNYNIRIISNIEYRYKMIHDTYFAFFIDTDNIWLLQSNLNNTNLIYYLNNFYKQIVISCGIGLRYDLKYIIARIDLSHKIFDSTKKFFNNSLLHNNIINFTIGYPF